VCDGSRPDRDGLEWIEAVKAQDLVMTQRNFRVQLLGRVGSDAAALQPPFDVVAVFHRRGRVPVKGTINGFPFRSSLMNMGEGHRMVVNAQLRSDARCKAGDTVTVLMAVDEDDRTVEVPGYLKKIIASDPKAREFWPKLSFTHQKEYVREIREAKKPETRQKRIAAMMDSLRKNQRKK
jgi:hypothetical protein